MQSIKRNTNINLGGSIVLCYIPVSLVDKDNYPVRIPGSLSLDEAIPLIGDAKWLKIEAVRETILNDDDTSTADAQYNHSVAGFYAGDMEGAAVQFDQMVHQRFLVLRKDANGFWVLKGSLKEPLSFTYKKVTRDRITGLKGFDFAFKGQCSKPELYYTANFDTDDGDVVNDFLKSTIYLKNSADTLLDTKIVLAGKSLELLAPDAVISVKNSANEVVDSGEAPSGETAVFSAPDAEVVLVDTEDNEIETYFIKSGGSEEIIAPDAETTLNGNPFISIKSGKTQNIRLLDENGEDVPVESVVDADIYIKKSSPYFNIVNSF